MSFGVVLGEVFDALVDAVEKLRDFLVAAVAADDRAVNLQQLRRLVQNSRHFSIFHVDFPLLDFRATDFFLGATWEGGATWRRLACWWAGLVQAR